MITTVIFDLDQTLLNRTATFTHFLEKQHGRFKDELGEVTTTDFVSAILQLDNNGYASKADIYRTVCSSWGMGIAEQLLADFHKKYGSEPILNDGALEVLEQLSKEYTLGLVTNGRTIGQNAKIDSAGIRHFFRTIKISETEGIKKPDPRIFEHCLRDLNIAPDQAVYVGDHPEKDVAAAQAVGMRGIWIANPHYERPEFADGVVKKLVELPLLISKF